MVPRDGPNLARRVEYLCRVGGDLGCACKRRRCRRIGPSPLRKQEKRREQNKQCKRASIASGRSNQNERPDVLKRMTVARSILWGVAKHTMRHLFDFFFFVADDPLWDRPYVPQECWPLSPHPEFICPEPPMPQTSASDAFSPPPTARPTGGPPLNQPQRLGAQVSTL